MSDDRISLCGKGVDIGECLPVLYPFSTERMRRELSYLPNDEVPAPSLLAEQHGIATVCLELRGRLFNGWYWLDNRALGRNKNGFVAEDGSGEREIFRKVHAELYEAVK